MCMHLDLSGCYDNVLSLLSNIYQIFMLKDLRNNNQIFMVSNLDKITIKYLWLRTLIR